VQLHETDASIRPAWSPVFFTCPLRLVSEGYCYRLFKNVGTSERTVSIHEMDGEMVAAMAAKHAVYLARNWGIARKSGFAHLDAAVGFSTPPAAAKMRVVSKRLGEERVSRTWRYQGSRPVVIDRVLYETTGDRLEARDLETDQLLWSWDDARSEEGERRLMPPAVANGRVAARHMEWTGRQPRRDKWSSAMGRQRWRPLPLATGDGRRARRGRAGGWFRRFV
jgi:hypothetical protein